MNATIEIPQNLYERARIRAGETGRTLADFVQASLESELGKDLKTESTQTETRFGNRKLLPAFKQLQQSGSLLPRMGMRDVTELISDDRVERGT